MIAELDILNGFASKIISDCIDITVEAIKKADKNRKIKNQDIETKIYQVIIDSLNYLTYNKYNGQDKLYDASESILKGYKSGMDSIDAIGSGLKIFDLDVDDDICQDFFKALCHKICKDENNDLYKEIVLIQQKQMNEDMQKTFTKNTRCHKENKSKLDYAIERTDYIKENIVSQKGGKIECSDEIFKIGRAEEYTAKWDKNVFRSKLDTEEQLRQNKRELNNKPLFDLENLLESDLDKSIYELRKMALDSIVDVEELLRKAYLISIVTKQKDIEEWILNEQNGYKSVHSLPEYRFLRGELKAYNFGRWIPTQFSKQEQAEALSNMPFTESISGIVEIYRNSNNGVVTCSITDELTKALNKGGSFATVYSFFISTGQLKKLISSVQNKILHWIIELEKSGYVIKKFYG